MLKRNNKMNCVLKWKDNHKNGGGNSKFQAYYSGYTPLAKYLPSTKIKNWGNFQNFMCHLL